jgi:hypothetical protein
MSRSFVFVLSKCLITLAPQPGRERRLGFTLFRTGCEQGDGAIKSPCFPSLIRVNRVNRVIITL